MSPHLRLQTPVQCPAHLFNNCPINGFIRVRRIHLIYFCATIKFLSVFTTTTANSERHHEKHLNIYFDWILFGVWFPARLYRVGFYLLIELADCLVWLDANMTLNEDQTTWAREWVDETRTTQQTVETSGVILGWEHNDGLSHVHVHAPTSSKWSFLSASSMVNAAYDPAQTAVSSFCNLMPVCCSAVSGGEVYKCFFLCQGRLSRWSSLSLSSRTITSLGLTNAKVSVSSKSWCFAPFCFVGILTTFNFATAVCEQHPTTNYIGHKTKRWQQTTQWCQLQTTAMICRISHPGDAEIPGTLRDISTFQLISI